MYKIPIKLDSIVLNEDEDLCLASIKLQIKKIWKTQDWHNLYGMLHVEAGWNVEEAIFEVEVKKKVLLLNKSTSSLKDVF